ncbi:MAG TPA: glycosyl hydrolase, partial [Thermoanaerobaculia bacterium]
IAVDPKDSNVVFVCATGHLFDDHPDRGVYRTKDGGKTWDKVLFVANDTGCSDVAIDPSDGRTVYAGMWQFRRKPYFFSSGGPKSGLYRSTDGGATWRKVSKGLPPGDLGRIGLTVSPVQPEVVFASVESRRDAKVPGSEDSSFYRSGDRGETWVRQSTASPTTGRPFYFSNMAADPKNADRVYKTTYNLHVTDDAGKSWSALGGNYHGDTHAVWINPKNTEELLVGTDGGVYHSADRGAHWRFVSSLPVAQFYHVSSDSADPYNLYGGLQDNLVWYGPSRYPGEISPSRWTSLLFCDGFWTFVDPTDEDFVYCECQGGWIFRTRKSTREIKDIKPAPKEGEPKYRFNWNAPIHISATQPGTIYLGGQFLFRSRDRGESWERISPDLTTNDREKQKQEESGGLTRDNSTAENHCTIFAISESPKNKDVIWTGTDDGNLQITRDGGKSWTNVAGNVTGLPKGTWVSRVEASTYEEGTAFATFDGHMTGDMKTWVYRTADFGKTWKSLATADLKGYAHVVKQDPVNPNLLFLGTESGLFVSLDGGASWAAFRAGMPAVAVRDLEIQRREGDLLIATHGRGIYILDDLDPLRALTPKVLESDVAFLPTRPAALAIPASPEVGWSGDGNFSGRSLPELATITYYLKKRHIIGDLKLEISDPDGKLVSTINGGKRKGINRVEWAMRGSTPRYAPGTGQIPSFASIVGPRVLAGTYKVKMIKGKDTYSTDLKVVYDRRSRVSDADRKVQSDTAWKLHGLVEGLTVLVAQITDARDQSRARAEGLPANDALRKKLEALSDELEAQRTALVSTAQGEGISGEEKLREELGMLYGNVNGSEERPTASQLARTGVLAKDLDSARAKYEGSLKKLIPLNPELEKRKLMPIQPVTEEEWRKKTAA